MKSVTRINVKTCLKITMRIAVVFAAVAGLFGAISYAEDRLEELSASIIEARSGVEQQSRDFENYQKTRQGEFDSLIAQRSDLDLQIQKENLRQAQLTAKINSLKTKLGPISTLTQNDQKTLLEWADRFERIIESALPFEVSDRLARVERLRKRVKLKNEGLDTLLAEAWGILESELKSTSENSYKITTIRINNELRSAEVARLGLFQMFFLLPNGEAGATLYDGKQWQTRLYKDEKSVAVVKRMVRQFQQKKSSGYYELPDVSHGQIVQLSQAGQQ